MSSKELQLSSPGSSPIHCPKDIHFFGGDLESNGWGYDGGKNADLQLGGSKTSSYSDFHGSY